MAPTAIPVNTVVVNGIVPAAEVAADVANGNQFASNGSTTMLEMTNTTAVAQPVTVVTPGAPGGNAIADKVYNLPATIGAKIRCGPFDPSLYGNPVLVSAASATVTFAAYQI